MLFSGNREGCELRTMFDVYNWPRVDKSRKKMVFGISFMILPMTFHPFCNWFKLVLDADENSSGFYIVER